MDAILIRIAPNAGTVDRWKVQHKKLGGVDFVLLTPRYGCDSNAEVQAAECDYFTAVGVLQIRQIDRATTIYNNFQPFQNLLVPRKIDVSFGTDPLLAISIDALEPIGPSQGAISKSILCSEEITPVKGHLVIPSGELHLIRSIPPHLPDLRQGASNAGKGPHKCNRRRK